MEYSGRVEYDGMGMLREGNNSDILRRAWDFEVARRRGCGRPNTTWKRQVKEHIDQIRVKK